MSKRSMKKERARTARRRAQRRAAKARRRAGNTVAGGASDVEDTARQPGEAGSTDALGSSAEGLLAGGAAPGQRVHSIVQWNDDGLGADGLYDDCPICRAMRAAGAVPDDSGAVEMTPQLQARYEQALDEIIAKEGWPEEALNVTGEELMNWFDAIRSDLEARGYPTDVESMTDAELEAHWDLVEETSMRLFGRRGAARRPALAS